MASKEKIAYIKDIDEATAQPSGTSGDIAVFGSSGKGVVDSGKKLDDFYDKQQANEQISQAVEAHAEDSNIHVTSEEKAAWNAKQDAISDLGQIRQNASKGAAAATAIQQHEEDSNVHVTPEEKAAWNTKQDAIGDLSDIRNNADKGAEAAERDEIAIQDGAVSAIKTAVSTSGDTTVASNGGSSAERMSARGFRMNLLAYAGLVATGVKIREVYFKSIGVYLKNSTDTARLAIYKVGAADPVAVSSAITLSTADGGALNTFEFEETWLEADSDYEFRFVKGDSETYVANLTMYLVSDPVVGGFKEFSGGSWSSWEGCFRGSSVIRCKTSTLIELAKKSDVPTKTSQLTNDSGFLTAESEVVKQKADATSLDGEYDGSRGYSVGETCVHDGVLYRCTAAVEAGDDWDDSHWTATTLKAELKQKQSDWNTTDENDPSYIKNKPNIPSAVTIDNTLSQAGAAADAKAVGDALVGINPRYAFAALSPSESGNVLTYQLVDRAVNYIAVGNMAYGYSISLLSPTAPSAVGSTKMERDFVVVFNVDTESDLFDKVEVEAPGNSVCYNGDLAEVTAEIGKLTAYRFTEIGGSGSSTYLVTGASDPAYVAVREIERALDDVLADGGLSELTTPFKPGMYFYNEDTGKYHKLELHGGTEDDDEVNIGVEQEGVQK